MPLETHILYNGEVTLTFETKRHIYRVTDEQAGMKDQIVPSVTGTTNVMDKPALVAWAANTCAEYVRANLRPGKSLDEIEIASFAESMRSEWRKVSKTAANIGSLVHAYAEQYARWKLGDGPEPKMPVNTAARQGVGAFLGWLEDHHVEFLHAERKVYSRAGVYAGTVDLVARVDGVLTVVDYKTSSGWYPEYNVQVAGYREALEEELELGIEKSLGLVFSKESGQCKPVAIETHEKDFDAFMACLGLKVWQESRKKR